MALRVVLAAVGLGVCVLAGVIIGVGVALGVVGFGLALRADGRGVGSSRLGVGRLVLLRLGGLGLLVVLLNRLGLLVGVGLGLLVGLPLLLGLRPLVICCGRRPC